MNVIEFLTDSYREVIDHPDYDKETLALIVEFCLITPSEHPNFNSELSKLIETLKGNSNG